MVLRNPAQAIAWANSQGKWAPHSCLNFVKNAYYGDNPTQNSIDGKPYLSNAVDGWNNSTQKHPGDRNPPVGALMYFDGAHPGDPGDVQIYIGNGQSRRTDVGAWGAVGTTSMWWMETAVHRKYLGWTGDILGYPYFDVNEPAVAELKVKDVNDMGAIVIGIKGTSAQGAGVWMVDLGARTKWNIIKGMASATDAFNRLNVWKAMGITYVADQAPWVLAGFTDITERA